MTRNLIESIASKKVNSFWIALLFLIATGLLMRPSSACLITSQTPLAIVDLELAFDQTNADLIRTTWHENDCKNQLALSSNGLEAAVVNIALDFLFIVAYTYFFVVLVVVSIQKKSDRSAKVAMFLIYMTLTIAVLDVIENLFMLIFLKWYSISSFLFAFPASLKFGLIAVLIIALLFRFGLRLLNSIRS